MAKKKSTSIKKKRPTRKAAAKQRPTRKAAPKRKKAATGASAVGDKSTASKKPTKQSTRRASGGGSTKKKTTRRSSASTARPMIVRTPMPRPPAVKRMDPDQIEKVKSSLTTRELRDYRKLLLLKRAEILGDMQSMSTEALNGDSANLSHMPLHMADVGSDHYEQELTLGLVESERKLVHEIDEALERIAAKRFGVCQITGKPINKARLQAKPWAKYCIEAARELERTGARW